MFVGGRGVLVSLLAMFVSRFRVLLRLFVLAEIMMMGGLMMMMRGRVVVGGGLMMMLTGGVLRLGHGAFPPNQSLKTSAGCSPSMGRLSVRGNPDIDWSQGPTQGG
jgi:hypothetical protein